MDRHKLYGETRLADEKRHADELNAQVVKLLEALQSDNPNVRASAVLALSTSNSASALIGVMELLTHADWVVRHSAVEALGKMSNRVVVPSLILALDDENEWVRLSAVRALGSMGDTRAVPSLIRVLRDNNEEVRHDAAVMLGRLQDNRAVPELLKRLSDTTIYGFAYTGQRVCDAAIDALGRIGNKAAAPRIEKMLKKRTILTRYNAAYALGEIGEPQSIVALVELLSDERIHFLYGEKRICDVAAEAIEKIGTPEAFEILMNWRSTNSS